jgi:hypothetical protein
MKHGMVPEILKEPLTFQLCWGRGTAPLATPPRKGLLPKQPSHGGPASPVMRTAHSQHQLHQQNKRKNGLSIHALHCKTKKSFSDSSHRLAGWCRKGRRTAWGTETPANANARASRRRAIGVSTSALFLALAPWMDLDSRCNTGGNDKQEDDN